jgi:hypothetical protein
LVAYASAIQSIRAELVQPWGIKMGADLVQPWADAANLRQSLYQPWSDATRLQARLVQPWDFAHLVRAQLAQSWHIFGLLRAELAQRWAITADLVQAELVQPWHLRERDLLQAQLVQRWGWEVDSAVCSYRVEVLADGRPVAVSLVNIEAGLDQDVLAGEIHIASEADYLRCPLGARLVVTVTAPQEVMEFNLVVTSPRITEEHGNTQYIVEVMSPAVLLGEPYAKPLSTELSGLASAIAATLAAPLPLLWSTVDWEIPPGIWMASGQTPLALLKQLAGAAGAVVQSRPDGAIEVLPAYPQPVNRWDEAVPGLTLVETMDCFTTGSTPDLRSGTNVVLVSNQLSGSDSLRLDETAISAAVKELRGYQVPWVGDFDLTHTGGDWVRIERLGIEERAVEETVEIVAGSGRTGYPIHGLTSVAWGQANLGAVSVAEDGTVWASLPGESLLTLTYTTRCLLWRVHDPGNEQLQLVVP